MRNSFCLALILLLIGFGYPQEWKAVVLKAKTVEAGRSGQLTIKLISGDTLNVPETDWSESWSEAVDDALKKQELERSARATAEPPSDETAAAMIRARCAAKWPDDYSMRKYCEDQQYEALRALRARKMEGALSKIRAQCAKKWSEDYTMRDYCEKQQLEALRALNY